MQRVHCSVVALFSARRRAAVPVPVLAASLLALLPGCYGLRPSSGGGQTSFTPPRTVAAADVLLPPGYRIEPVATGLTFPTGVAFDAEGRTYVVESGYAYGEVWTTPRLLRVEGDGKLTQVAAGGRNGPWTGVTYAKGALYVAEGGALEGGRILRVTADGKVSALVEGLPSKGDHHTNGPVAGPDGWLYFAVGTATNSGVVGEDNFKFGWLKRNPTFHDVPCQDVTLDPHGYETEDLFHPESSRAVSTAAFSPFGAPMPADRVIRGQVPCSGAILRIGLDGGRPELVAWGFRNPFGLAFAPDGRLYATDNQYDVRGSRPIFGAGDLLWAVQAGGWHGWPDFHGRTPVYGSSRYRPQGSEEPLRVLTQPPGTPPKPAAIFGGHSSSDGLDFSRSSEFGHVGEAFVAQFGDQAPDTAKVLAPIGFKVVRVNVATGEITDFAVNRGRKDGPASKLGSGGLERPVAVRFDPSGRSLYVVDFGVMTMTKKGPEPQQGTGVLWRVTRAGSSGR